MNILILSKRQYMGKDLIDDQYGRFYEIPEQLSLAGHRVNGLCLSYRKRDQRLFNPDAEPSTSPAWYSANLGNPPPLGLFRYLAELDRIIESDRPDILYGCSDAIHAIIASYAAKRHGIKLIIDLYDNFESYTLTKTPGIGRGFIRAVRQADGISAVSDRLRHYIARQYGLKQPIMVLGNAINKALFTPRDKTQCREYLGLPENGVLIGTAGALHKNRDIETLYRAFDKLKAENTRVQLVLAGPRDKRVKMPSGNDVHDLGFLEHGDVAAMYSALDLGVICNTDSAFGRYCYPQKFFEILACATPVIAASVGTLQDMLEQHAYALYTPGDPESLASAVQESLARPRTPDIGIPDWADRARELESFFYEIVRSAHQPNT